MEMKGLTANQLYKQYREEGGTLNFSEWLNREKKKGVFPINKEVNDEVYMALNGMNEEPKRFFGLPTTPLIIMGVVIIGAVVYYKMMKKK